MATPSVRGGPVRLKSSPKLCRWLADATQPGRRLKAKSDANSAKAPASRTPDTDPYADTRNAIGLINGHTIGVL